MKMSSRLLAIVGSSVIGLFLVSSISLYSLQRSMTAERNTQIVTLLKLARAQVSHYQAQEQAGKLPREQAQARAAEALAALRSGNDYLFARSDDNVIIAHPDASRVGKVDVGAKLPDGRTTVQAYRDALAQQGEFGLVVILNAKPGRPKDELMPKLNGVTRIDGWGWTIGTGFFVDDINAAFWRDARTLAIVGVALIAFTVALAWPMSRRIYAQLGGEIDEAATFTRHVAEGNLAYVPARAAPPGSLMANLARMQDELRDMVGHVQRNATAVDQSVHLIFGELEDIRHAATSSSDATSSAAAAVEEMTVGVGMIADSAQESEQHSDKTAHLSLEGEKLSLAAAEEIGQIAGQIETTTQMISSLAARSRQIGGVAQVIQEIAEQTNMLALNAAIEAARAGEQGRGFAVVADEVRKLAERTARATAEIAQTIDAIQGDTQRAVDGMEAVKPQVARGVERATQASRALREIRQSTDETLAKIREVAHATSEQRAASDAIANNVGRIVTMVGDTELSVQKTADTAGELRDLSIELRATVAKFVV